MNRTVLVTVHTGRGAAVESARLVVNRLVDAGITVRVLEQEAVEIGCVGAEVVPCDPGAAKDAEVMIVLGGRRCPAAGRGSRCGRRVRSCPARVSPRSRPGR
ncbi:hypothetical protein AB0K48_37175, partial [Nonomuraea sp. NPDC055795]